MAVGDVAECTVKYQNTVTGKSMYTVLHLVQVAEPIPSLDEYPLASAISDFIAASILLHLPDAITYVQTTAQRIFPTPRTAGRTSAAGTGPGGRFGVDPLPDQCALLIQKRTAYAGRRFRGRLYQPGMGEPDQSSSRWAGDDARAVASAWMAVLVGEFVDSATNSWQFVVCPKSGNPVQPITNCQWDKVVRSQRRRQTRGIIIGGA
jgi:hypothetical protein